MMLGRLKIESEIELQARAQSRPSSPGIAVRRTASLRSPMSGIPIRRARCLVNRDGPDKPGHDGRARRSYREFTGTRTSRAIRRSAVAKRDVAAVRARDVARDREASPVRLVWLRAVSSRRNGLNTSSRSRAGMPARRRRPYGEVAVIAMAGDRDRIRVARRVGDEVGEAALERAGPTVAIAGP